nr:PH domain-containing protein [Nocardioides panzhihuensis]
MLLALAALLVIGAIAVAGGSSWILGGLALLLLIPVPDLVKGLGRRPHLRIGPAGIRLHGWTSDVEIAWSDVLEVSQASINAQTPIVRVRGRDGAASYGHTKRGILFGKRPADPDLDVPATSLDDPYGIYVVLNGLAMARADERPGMVAAIPGLLEDRADGVKPENPSRR